MGAQALQDVTGARSDLSLPRQLCQRQMDAHHAHAVLRVHPYMSCNYPCLCCALSRHSVFYAEYSVPLQACMESPHMLYINVLHPRCMTGGLTHQYHA